MIIPSIYKRTVPTVRFTDGGHEVTDELQNLWDQLYSTHRALEQVTMHFDAIVESYKAPMKDLHEENQVLHARIDELEKELYGE